MACGFGQRLKLMSWHISCGSSRLKGKFPCDVIHVWRFLGTVPEKVNLIISIVTLYLFTATGIKAVVSEGNKLCVGNLIINLVLTIVAVAESGTCWD